MDIVDEGDTILLWVPRVRRVHAIIRGLPIPAVEFFDVFME